ARFSRDWSSDVCSSDLLGRVIRAGHQGRNARRGTHGRGVDLGDHAAGAYPGRTWSAQVHGFEFVGVLDGGDAAAALIRVRVVDRVDIGEEQQRVGLDQVGHQGGQAVVV